MDTEFLNYAVFSWELFRSYQDGLSIDRALNVINDTAERLLMLGADFVSNANVDRKHHNVLQVVENDRYKRPNQRYSQPSAKQSTLGERTWFLKL